MESGLLSQLKTWGGNLYAMPILDLLSPSQQMLKFEEWLGDLTNDIEVADYSLKTTTK